MTTPGEDERAAAVVTSRGGRGTRFTVASSRRDRVDATAMADGLSAHVQLTRDEVGTLPAFVAGMVERFAGWDGPVSWSSVEGQVEVVARWTTGGRVELEVTLTPDLDRRWEARVRLDVDAGAQMQTWATDLVAVLHPERDAP